METYSKGLYTSSTFQYILHQNLFFVAMYLWILKPSLFPFTAWQSWSLRECLQSFSSSWSLDIFYMWNTFLCIFSTFLSFQAKFQVILLQPTRNIWFSSFHYRNWSPIPLWFWQWYLPLVFLFLVYCGISL